MFKMIQGLPSGVLGIEAVGEVTHEDYRDVLIPAAEKLLAEGPLKVMYVIGTEFKGYEAEAMWDDGMFGLKHWSDFSHIAFVTDHPWLKGVVSLFVPLFPGQVRIFSLEQMDKAKAWLSGA